MERYGPGDRAGRPAYLPDRHRESICDVSLMQEQSASTDSQMSIILIEYSPTMPWHSLPASVKQLAALERIGIATHGISNRGQAAAILNRVFKRRACGLATYKQTKLLAQLGHPKPQEVSFDKANAFISAKLKRRAEVA